MKPKLLLQSRFDLNTHTSRTRFLVAIIDGMAPATKVCYSTFFKFLKLWPKTYPKI